MVELIFNEKNNERSVGGENRTLPMYCIGRHNFREFLSIIPFYEIKLQVSSFDLMENNRVCKNNPNNPGSYSNYQ